MSGLPPAPTIADIEDAAARLAGHATVTPLLPGGRLDEACGGRLLIKAECLQRTGAFKFRGAWNRLSRLEPAARSAGVVAFSSGNHGQAVAAAAQALGIAATIVMPADAPKIKTEGVRAHGARVVAYDPATEVRENVAATVAAETGALLVPPFDDPDIIAGQGTAGLELVAQAAAMGAIPDAVLVPCSGGGLVAGCAIAIKANWPETEIYAVEPAEFDDTARSLAAGERLPNAPGGTTFCDALKVPVPGALTFAVNRHLLAGGIAVSDDDTAAAMAAAFRHLKLVLEPGGAIALAAALSGAVDCRGRTVAVVCSGGNVDAETFVRAITR